MVKVLAEPGREYSYTDGDSRCTAPIAGIVVIAAGVAGASIMRARAHETQWS